MKNLLILSYLLIFIWAGACKNKNPNAAQNTAVPKDLYTCPMPQDSVFSNKPGTCPKCGMSLVKLEQGNHEHEKDYFTCPMHAEIKKDKPGACPICGMDLVKIETQNKPVVEVDLESLLKPTNEFVVSTIPITTIEKRLEKIEIEALGNIGYDTKQIGSISARVSGRIEKLYVHDRYQKISKGQRILDIYSPEILTAQQNLLFLLKNDISNISFIQAAKEKLLLLGMSIEQMQQIVQSGKPSLTISVFSNYTGHIHETANTGAMSPSSANMKDISQITAELSLKEGMYLQKGQTIFNVFNPDKAWIVLNIYGNNQSMVKKGNSVEVIPETAPDKKFMANLDFIEPFYRKESKTVSARVYFNNNSLKIPIGSQVRAIILGNTKEAYWLPKEATLSLGMDKIVFSKTDGGFKPIKVLTGLIHNNQIQIISGLGVKDSVAINAQYLMDSESFIKIKN